MSTPPYCRVYGVQDECLLQEFLSNDGCEWEEVVIQVITCSVIVLTVI